jgi:hypothetical protein
MRVVEAECDERGWMPLSSNPYRLDGSLEFAITPHVSVVRGYSLLENGILDDSRESGRPLWFACPVRRDVDSF